MGAPQDSEGLRIHGRSGGIPAIVSELEELKEEVRADSDDAPPVFHRSYLQAQVQSLQCFLQFDGRRLVGETLRKAVADILGIPPPKPYPVHRIQKKIRDDYEAHKKDQAKRAKAWEGRVTPNFLREAIETLRKQCEKDILPHLFHGKKMIPVLKKSRVSVVPPKPGHPPCYYVFRGNGRGTISISGRHAQSRMIALRTVMHELLPGHHLYYLYREALYKWGYLAEEALIDLLYSGETPVNEGIAECGLSLLESLDSEVRQRLEAPNAMEHFCKKVLYNVWHGLFLTQTLRKREAAKYLKDLTDYNYKEIRMWLNFIDAWRIYYPSYPVGTSEVEKFLGKKPRTRLKYLYLPKSLAGLRKLGRYLELSKREKRNVG